MTKVRVVWLFVSLVVVTTLAVSLHAQDSRELKAELSLAGGKTVFRSGETVRLVITFTSNTPDYTVDVDRETYLDKLSIDPTAGLFDRIADFYGGPPSFSDSISLNQLSTEPVNVTVSLNDYFRFETAGKYTVRLTSKRVRRKEAGTREWDPGTPIEVKTNPISFEIVPMTEADEAAEAAGLAKALVMSGDRSAQSRLAEELANLPGDGAVPEKVKQFLVTRKDPGNSYGGALYQGLFVSRNRSLVAKFLEPDLLDLSKPVDTEVLGVLSALRARAALAAAGKAYVGRDNDETSVQNEVFAEAEAHYLQLVIDGMPKRQGTSLFETVYALFRTRQRQLSPTMVARLRDVILKNFDSLNAFSREDLLSNLWDQIKDPSLEPS
ncbi:MAG TPA: hypothetical protein VGI80_00260, partial [Pyrinomonadaceae bacterium]